MIRVCVAGVTGWTGRALVPAIEASPDLQLVAGVSRTAAGTSLSDAVGARSDGAVHASVRDALASVPADVLVDYTSAAAVRANVIEAVEAGVHVVVGSSGLTASDYAELDELAREHGVGVIAAGNFSIQAAVLQHAAMMAAEYIAAWEVIDYAAADKPDVPSGTAREIAEALSEVRRPDPAVPVEDILGPREARGVEVAGTRIHSVRLPSFVVSTEVVFGGEGERLILRHDPGPSPEPYVSGTLLAVRRVSERTGVRRGLGTLLFPGRE